MTTIQQQIDFVQELRNSFDSNERQRIENKRPPAMINELMRDILENLNAIKFMQLTAGAPEFCRSCNQPITGDYAVMGDDKLCTRCVIIEKNCAVK